MLVVVLSVHVCGYSVQCVSYATVLGEIVLHPADEGQKPETVVQGLHLLSLEFSCIIILNSVQNSWNR